MSETTDLLTVPDDSGDAVARDARGGSPADPVGGTPAASNGADVAEPPGAARARRRGTGLTAMVLPELQALAAQLGIPGTARMRKAQLIAEISSRQGAASTGATGTAPVSAAPVGASPVAPANGRADGTPAEPRAVGQPATPVIAPTDVAVPAGDAGTAPDTVVPGTDVLGEGDAGHREQRANGRVESPVAEPGPLQRERRNRRHRGEATRSDATEQVAEGLQPLESGSSAPELGQPSQPGQSEPGTEQAPRSDRDARPDRADTRPDRGERERSDRGQRGDRPDRGQRSDRPDQRSDRPDQRSDRPDQRSDREQPAAAAPRNRDEGPDDEFDARGRRRRGRYRDRNRKRGREGAFEPVDAGEVADDDVLVPVAGLVDVLDSYAFVRTSGYLPGPNDVYLSLAQVRRYGLRKGDAVTGAIRQQREGERREKFNALVRMDTVNGTDPEQARTRVEFNKLTPLYPQDRLRLETEPNVLTTRIIDLVAPIGKGQRGLIVSPPKAGKTMVLQAIANAITTNNPETHLMVVLVDERPEEVTDMQRTVKGEVIASTFDRPADDHTTVAELAIERAKRLVELGHDVVLLLDSITRLGRAYNIAAPASGRILSGGVDSTALYPPKRFFGAARNIENGGSLTILATALVETGSRMDEVIFEEFKGTGNMELKLDRKLADKRIFPAVDVDASSTRKEEILMARDELQITWKLRRVMAALDQQQAVELLLDRLKQTRSNAEFLMQVQKTTPLPSGGED